MTPDESVADAWRTYFRERCRSEIGALAEEYPDRRSLRVDLVDVHEFDPDLAAALFDAPDRALGRATAVLRDTHDAFGRVHVRVRNNPGLLSVPALRARHLGELVTVEGTIAAADPLRATLTTAAYDCPDCGEAFELRPDGVGAFAPSRCEACGAGGPFPLDEARSTFVDLRRVTLAALSEPSDLDRETVDVFLRDDLVDRVAVGDQLLVTGVVRTERSGDANRFDLYVDANAVTSERSEDRDDDLKSVLQSRWENAVGHGGPR